MAKLTFAPRKASQVRRSQASDRRATSEGDAGDEVDGRDGSAVSQDHDDEHGRHQEPPTQAQSSVGAVRGHGTAHGHDESAAGPSHSTTTAQQLAPSSVIPSQLSSVASSAHGPLDAPSSSAMTIERLEQLHHNGTHDQEWTNDTAVRAPVQPWAITDERELQSKVDNIYRITQQADQAMNKSVQYQSSILDLMKRYAAAQERLDELELLLEEVLDEFKIEPEHKILVRNMSTVTVPWFKSQFGRNLPPTRDALVRDLHARLTGPNPMNSLERNALKKQVKESNQRSLAKQAQDSGESITRKLNATDNAYLVNTTDNLDWDRIASFLPGRTVAECKIQWLQHDHPLVNKKQTWTRKEIDDLERVAEEHGHRDWQAIADALGTRRTAADCLRQFRKKGGNKQAWTPQQDEKLIQAINIYGEQWNSVASFVGRKPAQCITRWTKTIRPHKRGKWSAEEDEALRQAVSNLGQKWTQVRKLVPGRTDAQCRERYCNYLDPNLIKTVKSESWTPEDDDLILELRDKENKSWSEVAARFNGARTDGQVLSRYLALKKQVISFKGRGKYKRKGLSTKKQVANRVKLEKEKTKRAHIEKQMKGDAMSKGKGKQRDVVDDETEEGGKEGGPSVLESGAEIDEDDQGSNSAQTAQSQRATVRTRAQRRSYTATEAGPAAEDDSNALKRTKTTRPRARVDEPEQDVDERAMKRARKGKKIVVMSEDVPAASTSANGDVQGPSTADPGPGGDGPAATSTKDKVVTPAVAASASTKQVALNSEKDVDELESVEEDAQMEQQQNESVVVKRPRGRPRKYPVGEEPVKEKKPRGRPRKFPIGEEPVKEKRPRGRPRKDPVGQEPVKEKRPRGRPRKNPLPPQTTTTGSEEREEGTSGGDAREGDIQVDENE
ncbi:hypothetical protein ACM66B_005767 [Microbotryomycetes sp. NB124-2]